jgi:hypothetical protein
MESIKQYIEETMPEDTDLVNVITEVETSSGHTKVVLKNAPFSIGKIALGSLADMIRDGLEKTKKIHVKSIVIECE